MRYFRDRRAELEALLERLRSFAARDSGHLIRNWDTGLDHVKTRGSPNVLLRGMGPGFEPVLTLGGGDQRPAIRLACQGWHAP
jgi:hypothetical protein